MNARAIVAVILALTVFGFFAGMFAVRFVLPPEVKPSQELLELFKELVSILIGGLMVWLGMDRLKGGK